MPATATPRSTSRSISKIVLERILVLAVAQEVGRDETKPRVVNAVTLEVTPEQAENLDLARSVGSLSLALRNQVDPPPGATAGATKLTLLPAPAAAAEPCCAASAATTATLAAGARAGAARRAGALRQRHQRPARIAGVLLMSSIGRDHATTSPPIALRALPRGHADRLVSALALAAPAAGRPETAAPGTAARPSCAWRRAAAARRRSPATWRSRWASRP